MHESAAGFSIERSENGAEGWKKIADIAKVDVTDRQDRGLSPGTTYRYRLIASSKVGGLRYFLEATASTPVLPVAPSRLTATAVSSTQIDLKWSSSTSSKNDTRFRIERKDANSQSWKKIADVAATEYADTKLSPETPYAYRVLASVQRAE